MKTPETLAAELNRDILIVQAEELRELRRLVDEAEKFISGFAASAESDFTRRKKTLKWLEDYRKMRCT
jgi:hypothetical protein